MIRRLLTFVLLSNALLSCGDNTATAVDNACGTVALPLRGNANAPTLTDVGLEVQANGIVVVATASDPQGSENMRSILQTIGVFPDRRCEGTAIVLRDDLAYSGVEETFGTAVDAASDPALYNEIAANVTWPVEVNFLDIDGNRSTGRVPARVIN